jgi:hypothetical protein
MAEAHENMAKKLKPGQRVKWQTSRGKTSGVVEKELTSKTKIKGHTAKPTADKPEYLVRSDKSGKKAAHAPEALEPISKSAPTPKGKSIKPKRKTAKKKKKS